MSEQPNDMDPTELMDEMRSLQLKLDSVIETLSSLNEKVNKINESQQMGAELVRKSANSINIAVRFMAGLRKLSHEELKNTLIDADAILNTVNPIPTHENVDETLEWNVTKVSLKTILKEVFDLLSSLPLDINVNANNPVASTSTEKKIQFWRRYKNKYNYIEHLKPKLPPLDKDGRPIRRVEPQQDGIVENNVNSIVQNNENSVVQNDVNPIVQNDENSIVQNDVNPIVQNDENSIVQNGENSIVPNDENSIVQNGENSIVRNDENAIVPNDENSIVQNNVNATAQNGLNNKTTFTINDIIQNAEVYEMFKSRLKNSPYEDPSFKNRVRNSQLTITLHNGQTIVRPVSHVAPLIVLKKCDDMCPIPLQNKETTDEHLPSTSSNINDSNRNNTIPKMTKRVTRSSKTNNATNSFNTNVKTTTRKRGSTKNSKCGPSKKKKKLK